MFAMEYLPRTVRSARRFRGAVRPAADPGEYPRVVTARVVCLYGRMSDAEFERVQHYLINPVESRLASLDKPEHVGMSAARPENVKRVDGFIGWTDEEVAAYWKAMGFAMSEADLCFCRDYFRDEEKRDPTVTELKVIDTYWSDHCRHTTFLTRLTSIEVESGALSGVIEEALSAYYEARKEVYGDRILTKNVTLMDMATMGMRLLKKQGKIPDLDESDEINALLDRSADRSGRQAGKMAGAVQERNA